MYRLISYIQKHLLTYVDISVKEEEFYWDTSSVTSLIIRVKCLFLWSRVSSLYQRTQVHQSLTYTSLVLVVTVRGYDRVKFSVLQSFVLP